VKYRFMNEHRHEYSLVLMCQVLKVARAGFYQWLNKPLSERAVEDQRLLGVIRNSYAAKFRFPVVVRRIADAVLAAQLGHLYCRFGFFLLGRRSFVH
jgi:hypothetical protein